MSINVEQSCKQLEWKSVIRVVTRDRQWTDLQGCQGGGGKLRGSSGSTDNPTSKKIHFCIIQTILNKISKKIFEKSLDLAIFVNFSDVPLGGGGRGGWYPHPLWRSMVVTSISFNNVMYTTDYQDKKDQLLHQPGQLAYDYDQEPMLITVTWFTLHESIKKRVTSISSNAHFIE